MKTYNGEIQFHIFAVANNKVFGENKIDGYAKVPINQSESLQLYIVDEDKDIELYEFHKPVNKQIKDILQSNQFRKCLIDYQFASINEPVILKINKCLIKIRSKGKLPVLKKKYISERDKEKTDNSIMPRLLCKKQKRQELQDIIQDKTKTNIIKLDIDFKDYIHKVVNNLSDVELNTCSDIIMYKEMAKIYELEHKHSTLLEMKTDIISELDIAEEDIDTIILNYYRISLTNVEKDTLLMIQIDTDTIVDMVAEILYLADNEVFTTQS